MLYVLISSFIYGLALVIMFILGINVGMKLNTAKPINLNPIKTVVEKVESISHENKEKKKSNKLNIILSNIDNYNGKKTSQKKV